MKLVLIARFKLKLDTIWPQLDKEQRKKKFLEAKYQVVIDILQYLKLVCDNNVIKFHKEKGNQWKYARFLSGCSVSERLIILGK